MAVSAYASARSQTQAGNANAAIQRQNAAIATEQAHSALVSGSEQGLTYAQKLRAMQGRAIATAGAEGISPQKGSALDILTQNDILGGGDILRLSNNAAMTAFGYEGQATNFGNEAALAAYTGKEGAATTLLGAGASAAAMYWSPTGTITPTSPGGTAPAATPPGAYNPDMDSNYKTLMQPVTLTGGTGG